MLTLRSCAPTKAKSLAEPGVGYDVLESAPVSARSDAYTAMKWSIIVPCANDSTGLQRTLSSIVDLMPRSFDGEVIVVVDGPYTVTKELAESYANNVQVVQLTTNQGSYAARNAGIEAAQGDNFAFIDAGCWLHPDWFVEANLAIAEADYVAGDVVTDISRCRTLGEKYSYLTEFNVKGFFETSGFGPTANVLVCRRLIQIIGPFDARLWSGGDREFGTRVSLYPEFRKVYGEKVKVYHEPRTLRQMLNKERRVTLGFHDLKRLYPDRFPSRPQPTRKRLWHYAVRLSRLILPPSMQLYTRSRMHFGRITGIQLYVFAWALRGVNAVIAWNVLRKPEIRGRC